MEATKKKTTILGISAFYHDSAAALLQDGEILSAAQEERFSRKKHDSSFPKLAVKFCLEHAGVSLDEVDIVIFYDKPFLKFERILESYYAFAPKGFKSFYKSMPVWVKEKLFLRRMIQDELKQLSPSGKSKIKILFSEHHLSHAASAFYPSPFEDAAILAVDGVGEWATATISEGRGSQIKLLKELRFPHSVGLLYSAFTYYVGFRVNSGEYKLMGLAPYGDPDAAQTKKFIDVIKTHLIQIREDGSIWLNQEYFDYIHGLKMVNEARWEEVFGLKVREPESELSQDYCNLAFAIQNVTEEIVIKMAREAKRITGLDKLCLAGGVALNCVANGKILREGIFKEIYVQPASDDAGGALGAALSAHYIYNNRSRTVHFPDSMNGSYLGPEYSHLNIVSAARKYQGPYKHFEKFEELCDEVAQLLDQGNIVGWFQGRLEWGPRALGNRSILGDPRNPDMQKRLNLKIKFREGFRPFAPSVLKEDAKEYFDLDANSPYMTLVAPLQEKRRHSLPEDYYHRDLRDKLYYLRSDLPSITHLDFSARIQTVDQKTNPKYWSLLSAFKKRTGCSVMVNTSFNVRGEPIVNTPEDAYRCFMKTDMDYLVMDHCVFKKQEQPSWADKMTLKDAYGLD